MTLPLGVLEIWRADLDRVEVGDDALSAAEGERAARFRFEPDRVRWTRCRAVLRELLGSHLGQAPGDVELTAGAHGKPALVGGELEFNVSHSGDLALIALAMGNPVGVDVERARRVRDPLATAGRVLGSEVVDRLRPLPAAERDREFLRAWVRYEAALKCRGDRLGGPSDLGELHVIDLDAQPDAAAVALARAPESVVIRTLEPGLAEAQPGSPAHA